MPAFTADDVRRLAALAQLELTSEEGESFARQLSEILDFARQVQSVDTSSAAAADGFLLDPSPPPRGDTHRPSLPRDEVLRAAPEGDRVTGLLKVPRVLG